MRTWIPQVFQTCEMGVSSAYEPELIPQNQLAWMKNGRIRGGKAHTRPLLRERLVLPQGKIQGASYFSIQDGMIIAHIDGRIYRVRINNSDFSYEEITLPWINSPSQPYAWMQETVGSLVIQDGQSYPIIYDGSTARRSNPEDNEVPRGTVMAFLNGRLWVAVNANEVVAGDIKTRVFQSELQFTESQYFSGGGAFYFPFTITAMGAIPASGAAGYGSLMIFGKNQAHAVRADIAQRDLWPDYPGFIQPVLLSTGAAGHFSLTEVNQDLYWRDGSGGIRSLRSAAADELGGPGNAPISREVSRITDYESDHRLAACSSILFNNRLLMTASPFINIYGTTSFRNLISLDFSPLSSMRGKSPPSYDGQWEGLRFARLVTGQFRGERRAFALSTDSDEENRLWEIMDTGAGDSLMITAGTSYLYETTEVPMVIEYPARDWGDPKQRKRAERCDVFLSEIKGEVELEVYWRCDNYQQWMRWDQMETCAQMTDPSTAQPHVFLNIRPQERPQVMSYTIPDGINEITQRALHIGFEIQIRVVLRGVAKINRVVCWASPLPEEQYVSDYRPPVCVINNVTGNSIFYSLDTVRGRLEPPPLGPEFVLLESRTRTGEIPLYGYPEFCSPSLPPRAFLEMTFSGQNDIFGANTGDPGNGNCTGSAYVPGAHAVIKWQGSRTVNPDTGIESTTAEEITELPPGNVVHVGGLAPLSPEATCLNQPGCEANIRVTDLVYTYREANDNCCEVLGSWRRVTGTRLATLSNENTEASRISEFQANNPFGMWATVTDPEVEGLAVYQRRGAGIFTFEYREREFRVTVTGQGPGLQFAVRIPIYRRLYGSVGSFSLLDTLVTLETTDGSGSFVVSGTVDNDRGYETYVGTPVVTAVA